MSTLLKFIFSFAIGCFYLFSTVLTLSPTTTTSSVLRPTLKVPEVTFKANVTKPVSNVPFLITCHIENFDREGEHNYTVNYYKTAVAGNRTLIGLHEVTVYDSKSRLHLYINIPQRNAEVHQGPRYGYPYFDVVVFPTYISYLENYWCELNITSTQINPVLKKSVSTYWPGFPFVNLSILDVESAPNTYLARCTVSVFSNAERRPYTVQLLVSNIVMGTFRQSKPTEEVEFTLSAPYYEHLKVIGHGSNVSWPVFEFIFQSEETSTRPFKCKMWLTDAKQNEIVYGEFVSDSIEHV